MFEIAAFERERGAGFKHTSREVGLQQKRQMMHCIRREHTPVGTDGGPLVDWTGVLSQLPALRWSPLPPLFFSYWNKESQLCARNSPRNKNS